MSEFFKALQAFFAGRPATPAVLAPPPVNETQEQLFERLFWQLCETDFPNHRIAFGELFPTGLKAAIGGNMRLLEKECRRFFEENQPSWPRYDAYVAYYGETDPRLPVYEDGEEVEGADYREAGELLAHRIVMAFYAEKCRLRYLENVDNRPLWQLTVIKDGRAYPECLKEASVIQRFDSAYWRQKKLPCERLFCRCRIQALTEEEAAVRGST